MLRQKQKPSSKNHRELSKPQVYIGKGRFKSFCYLLFLFRELYITLLCQLYCETIVKFLVSCKGSSRFASNIGQI